MNEVAVGIDAGTSNSCIGVYQIKKVEIVPNSIGDTYTPSVVDILEEGELVGEESMLHKIDENNSKNRITEIKRIIGRKFSSLTDQEKEKYNAFEDPKNKDQILIKVKRKGKDEFLSPENIMTFIFKKLIRSASNFVNTSVKRAVITVPAYFDYNQRAAIIESAKNAGIEVLRNINEPTAAALAYGLGRSNNLSDSLAFTIMQMDNKTNRKVLVFDLGGGTFDVSILTIKDNKEFHVVTTSGDVHLGGDDFDNKLVDFCIERFCNISGVNETEIRKDKNVLRRLKIQCEKAKKKLSYSEQTNIKIYNCFKDQNLDVYITREDFNSRCEDLYERIKNILDKVIIESKFTKEEIDDLVLVGGSSRIPKIKTILIEKFGNEKIRDKINPDEAVAIGATWQAHKILKSNQDINIVDITPFTLGVATKSKNVEEQKEGSIMSILIPKNKEISCRSAERMYKTVEDNQKFFNIKLYAGENRFCKNNELLKEFRIDNLPEGKAGTVCLKISLEIDKDSILFINAEVESIGKKITEKYSLYDKINQGKEPSTKKVVKIKGKEKLEEIKELNNYMKEKEEYLDTLIDNEQKLKCLKNLTESCENLIEIYSYLSEQNDSDTLYQKLFESYRKILKYYSEMLINNEDDKANEKIINKIKEIFSKLINDDIESMINVFDQLKIKKPNIYIVIILNCADLLYDEGQRILDEKRNYARYYARKFFIKGQKIKSYIDENLKKDMEYKVEKLYNELEAKNINKVDQVDSFVISLKGDLKVKDSPYVTGFTKIGQIINRAMEPENIDMALDIFSEMADSLAKDKKEFTEEEAFCLVNIIKIKFSILGNKSLSDIKTYEILQKRIDLIIDRLDPEDIIWIKQYNDLMEEIKNKKNQLLEKVEKDKRKNNQKYIDELNSLYKSKIQEKKPMEFIDFILQRYPFIGYEKAKESLKGLSFDDIFEKIFAKYHPDNYSNRYDFAVYNEIYILLGRIKEDLRKLK